MTRNPPDKKITVCLICKTPLPRERTKHYPFCSEPCRLRDLGAWLDGRYAIPDADAPKDPPDSGEVL